MRLACVRVVVIVVASAGTTRADPAPVHDAQGAGSLRVDLQCADLWATPDNGLTVSVDGVPTASVGLNGRNVRHVTRRGSYETWVPADFGFDVAPGLHHVAIVMPGCAVDDRDLVIDPIAPTTVDGRLAITDRALTGPTGAPNHTALALGIIEAMVPARAGMTNVGGMPTGYSTGAATAHGVWLSLGFEHRRLALIFDISLAWTGSSGTVEPGPGVSSGGPVPYSDTLLDVRTAWRIGIRVPLSSVALAAGVGIGATVLDNLTGAPQLLTALAAANGGATAWAFVPVWASLTVKPWCGFGAQLLGSYDVGLGATSAATVGVGILIQPNSACSSPPNVSVH
jgi:hypothetical protein